MLALTVLVVAALAGVLLMFWALRATNDSDIGRRLPPAEVTGSGASGR